MQGVYNRGIEPVRGCEGDQSKSQHMCHNQQITVKLKAPSYHKNTMKARDDVQVAFSLLKLTRSLYRSRCPAERLHGSHASPHDGIGFIAFRRHKGSRLESRTTARYRSTGTKPHGPFMVLGLAGDADFRDEADFRTIRDPPYFGSVSITAAERACVRRNHGYCSFGRMPSRSSCSCAAAQCK